MLIRERLTGRIRYRSGFLGVSLVLQVEVKIEQASPDDLKPIPALPGVADIDHWNKKQAQRIEGSWTLVKVIWRDAQWSDFSTLNSQSTEFVK